jgi:hypothetical protein
VSCSFAVDVAALSRREPSVASIVEAEMSDACGTAKLSGTAVELSDNDLFGRFALVPAGNMRRRSRPVFSEAV